MGCELLAELLVDARAPERSGSRLIEWAAACRIPGVVIPRGTWRSDDVLHILGQEAEGQGRRWYVELDDSDDPDCPALRRASGYLIRQPQRCERLAALLHDCQKPIRLLVEEKDVDRLKGWLGLNQVTAIAMNRGERLRSWLRMRRELHQQGFKMVGYSDPWPEPWPALNGALANATVVVKGLTLNRSLGGPSHQGGLYPDEFAALAQHMRDHELILSGTLDESSDVPALAPRETSSIKYTESLVAARPLRAGEMLRATDVQRIAELRGLSGSLAPRLVGARLRYDRQPEEPITFGVIDPLPYASEISSDGPLEISIVIRSKNEARWLPLCLAALRNQRRPPAEIIVVDNDSSDESATLARRGGCRVLSIRDREFSFGRALNRGLEAASSPWVVSLSAHCIPVHDRWLEAFAGERPQDEEIVPFVAAVYGRQEPLPDTTDFDKRDLWTTFGAERRRQRGEDVFFHNANSMICKAVWQRLPFDERLNGLEDRDWANKVLADGHTIVYTPLASVHHYHGIHQGRNEARARRIVQVIELIQQRTPVAPPDALSLARAAAQPASLLP